MAQNTSPVYDSQQNNRYEIKHESDYVIQNHSNKEHYPLLRPTETVATYNQPLLQGIKPKNPYLDNEDTASANNDVMERTSSLASVSNYKQIIKYFPCQKF